MHAKSLRPNETTDLTIRDAVRQSARKLKSAGIEDGTLEAEVLLAHVLGVSRSVLLADPDKSLCVATQQLDACINRRLNHEPLAYIVGHREFYGLDFKVTRSALIPRPETELLVDHALELIPVAKEKVIADIGTGCGAIAVALAAHRPQSRFYGADIDRMALEVARGNARRHRVADRIAFRCGDLLEPLPESVDIIVANLPYVSDHETMQLSPEITEYEPLTALAGGMAGLDQIERLLAQASDKLNPGGIVLLEIGYAQGETVKRLAEGYFPQALVAVFTDLNRHDRVVKIVPGSKLQVPSSGVVVHPPPRFPHSDF